MSETPEVTPEVWSLLVDDTTRRIFKDDNRLESVLLSAKTAFTYEYWEAHKNSGYDLRTALAGLERTLEIAKARK